jgi:HSP20 family molecular chaperone IbpA
MFFFSRRAKQATQEKQMASKTQTQIGSEQSVRVVEADILDRMNETNELIAERAYEIYRGRGGVHGSDQDDWFKAEGEVLCPVDVEQQVTKNEIRLTAQLPDFEAQELEVAIGHRRAVICGLHSDSKQGAGESTDKKLMRIVELPFDVNPMTARATLQSGTLKVVLPRREKAA